MTALYSLCTSSFSDPDRQLTSPDKPDHDYIKYFFLIISKLSIFRIYIVHEIYTTIIDIPPGKTDGLQIDNSIRNKCSMFNLMFVHRQQQHNLVNGPDICTLGGLDNHDWYYTIWANMNLSYSYQRPFRWN